MQHWLKTIMVLVASGLIFSLAQENAPKVEIVESDRYGSHLVDGEGRSLYLFLNDREGRSSCRDACMRRFPPLLAEEGATAGEGVDESLLGTTERDDGSIQVTYNDRPLYYSASDENPGDTAGQGASGVWFLVTPEGERATEMAAGEGDASEEGEAAAEDENGAADAEEEDAEADAEEADAEADGEEEDGEADAEEEDAETAADAEGATEASSVWQGVFTEEQAGRGQRVYVAHCQVCHHESLLGEQYAPPLRATQFLRRWEDRSVSELYQYIHDFMPLGAGGSLSDQEYVDVTAFILQQNEFPAGSEELVPDPATMEGVAIEAEEDR